MTYTDRQWQRDVETVLQALDGEIMQPLLAAQTKELDRLATEESYEEAARLRDQLRQGDNPRRFTKGDRVYSKAERWAAEIVRFATVPEPVWVLMRNKGWGRILVEWPANGDLVRELPLRRKGK